MREAYRKRNHNEKSDFTKRDKTAYLKEHCLIADYLKIVEDTTGLFSRLDNPELDKLDKRARNIEYSFRFILVVCALASCLGIATVSSLASTFVQPSALENISYLMHETASIVIDYGAINDAVSKMEDVSWMEGIAQDICEKMHRSGRYKKYSKWFGNVVRLDATDFAFFKKPHCIYDLTATFHKGTREEKTWYSHKALVARFYLTKTVSFPIGIEFIKNKEENPNKQDCENQAATRLLARLKKRFPLMHFIISADALYANKTFIGLCTRYGWDYLFTLKPGCQPSLCQEAGTMIDKGMETGHARICYDGKETGAVYWTDNMGSIVNSSLPMNILKYRTEVAVTKSSGKARGIQSAALKRKDLAQDMAELSKDQSKYDLDERKPDRKTQAQREKAVKEEEKADKAKEELSKINKELAESLGDGQIEAGDVKVGDTIGVTYMYITSLPISKENVGDLLVLGRSRWMIEETFLREKTGAQKLEHLRSKDPVAMEFYFWMECIADSCMQIYQDYSRIRQVAGSETDAYRMLRESFEHDSLEETYDPGRACHRHYGDARNLYPTVRILPDAETEGPVQQRSGKKDTVSGKAARKAEDKKAGRKPLDSRPEPQNGEEIGTGKAIDNKGAGEDEGKPLGSTPKLETGQRKAPEEGADNAEGKAGEGKPLGSIPRLETGQRKAPEEGADNAEGKAGEGKPLESRPDPGTGCGRITEKAIDNAGARGTEGKPLENTPKLETGQRKAPEEGADNAEGKAGEGKPLGSTPKLETGQGKAPGEVTDNIGGKSGEGKPLESPPNPGIGQGKAFAEKQEELSSDAKGSSVPMAGPDLSSRTSEKERNDKKVLYRGKPGPNGKEPGCGRTLGTLPGQTGFRAKRTPL